VGVEAPGTKGTRPDELLALLDWKRRIFDLYHEVRTAADPKQGWDAWRNVRDELFGGHPQSPLPEVGWAEFAGLSYFPYDPALRTVADVVAVDPESTQIGASGGTTITFERFGRALFTLFGEPQTLDLYWLEGYGGGVFLPFADDTSGAETYAAGRYLLDTVKGADLGGDDGALVLDFNFAYQPSCAYDARWICPLAPPANRLGAPIRGGERLSPAE
jgi:uncharacterized protein